MVSASPGRLALQAVAQAAPVALFAWTSGFFWDSGSATVAKGAPIFLGCAVLAAASMYLTVRAGAKALATSVPKEAVA